MKHFKTLATPEEEMQIQTWLADDPDGSHVELYQSVHKSFIALTLYSDELQEKPVRQKMNWRSFGLLLKIAAAVVMVAVTAYLGRQSVYGEMYAMSEKIHVPSGKSMTLTLDDGTVMHLNSGTELEYPKLFNRKRRCVQLHSGEVFFEVAKDADRPFIVQTYATDIQVLGTEFDVEVEPEEDLFTTVLIKGAVSVKDNASGEVIYMKPNDKVSMKDGRLEKTHIVNSSAVKSWTDGILDFSNMPFDQIVDKLEKIYGVEIHVENPALKDISYSRAKVWISEGIEQVLSIMQLSAEFTYERVGNTIYIR